MYAPKELQHSAQGFNPGTQGIIPGKSPQQTTRPEGTPDGECLAPIGLLPRSPYPLALLNKLPNRLGRHRSGLPSHFAPGFEHAGIEST